MSWTWPGGGALISLGWLVVVKVLVSVLISVCVGASGCLMEHIQTSSTDCLTHTRTQTSFIRALQVRHGSKPAELYANAELAVIFKNGNQLVLSGQGQQLAFVFCLSGGL